MIPTPVAVTLTLCEKVIVEEGTRNVTLMSCFTRLKVPEFPSPPAGLFAYAPLTDGEGIGSVQLVLTRLETDETIKEWQNTVQFPDRFTVVRVYFRLSDCSFPAPGRYQFTLLVDGAWAAQCNVEVIQK